MIQPMLPIAMNSETVALVLDDNGQIIDECFNWETAQTMAGENVVIAVKDDVFTNCFGEVIVSKTKDEIQAMCDYEREIYADCFA